MDIGAVLMDLLYIISNYEKGRCDTAKKWRRGHTKSLKESIQFMKYIINILHNKQYVSQEELLTIVAFCEKNNNVIFFNNKFNKKIFIDETIFLLLDFDLGKQDFNEIINLMRDIINECIFLLESKEKKCKMKISYLLKAFHNLPRAFMRYTDQTLFNLDILPLSPDEALTCANFYMNQIQHKSI